MNANDLSLVTAREDAISRKDARSHADSAVAVRNGLAVVGQGTHLDVGCSRP